MKICQPLVLCVIIDDGDVEERCLYKEKIRKPAVVSQLSELNLKWLPPGVDVDTFNTRGRFRSREVAEHGVGRHALVYVDLPDSTVGWRRAEITRYDGDNQAHSVRYLDQQSPEIEVIDYTTNVVFLLKSGDQQGGAGPSSATEDTSTQVWFDEYMHLGLLSENWCPSFMKPARYMVLVGARRTLEEEDKR